MRKPHSGSRQRCQLSSPAACQVATTGHLRDGERGHADPRRHRLVQVDDVEALLARARAAADRQHSRREHDVRQRAVRRDDHRPADRDDVVRRLAVAPVPRVQRPRERPRRVVADDRPRLDAEPAQRLRLELRVLVDCAPERPREGHDDADLHAAILWARAVHSTDGLPGRPGRAPHAPRRLGRLRDHVEPRARAGHRAAGEGLLGVRPPRHRLRPARRPEPRRARRHLPLDGAHPVEPARRRALRARGDRRRVPLAGDHDARDPLQPDEAEPRRRARPRPHHPRRDPRPRPRRARVPAGARRPDPHDGPDVRPAARTR